MTKSNFELLVLALTGMNASAKTWIVTSISYVRNEARVYGDTKN